MDNIEQVNDAVHVAAQLGRLDFISVLLAIIALLGVIAALPVFWYIRKRAADEARAVVAIELEQISRKVEEQAIKRMEELLPELISDYSKFAQDAVTNEMANQIAAAQDQGGD